MKIIIIFPQKYFNEKQLSQLRKFDLEFIKGNNLDLEKLETLYKGEEFILSLDPTYLKDGWNALPVERVSQMKNLKALCLSTTSFSWINIEKLREMNIIVTNTPGKSTQAVAEFNIYMMFSLLRKLSLIIKNEFKMDYDHFLNEEVKDLKAGIIGLGNIGAKVAELCVGLKMEVSYWNRSSKNSPYKSVNLEELFKTSDVIFNTIATAPELKGFLNKAFLSKVKTTSIIVSTSDTHVFDEDYIFEQIKSDKLAGYAFESTTKKLQDLPGNVMVFPEQAYFTKGTLQNTARILTETILSVITGNPINKVN